jgi:hypothetical protein
MVYFATDGGIFLSLDNGDTFQGCNGGMQTAQFYQGSANSGQDPLFFIGGLQDNSTVVYEGCPNWRMVIGGDGGFNAINPLDDREVYGSIYWGIFFKSTDRARNFQLIYEGVLLNQANFIAPSALSPANPSVLYLGCDTLLRSGDGGQTWVAASGDVFDEGRPANAIGLSWNNPDKLYVSSCPFVQGSFGEVTYLPPARVLRSTDGGASWANISNGLPDRLTMDFAVHPTDDDIVYAAVGGYGTAHVYKTENGGETWSALDNGLPDLPFNAILLDPLDPQIVYAGCDLGLFVSEDGGNTWAAFNEGLDDGMLVMDISASLPAKKLRVVTHGRGAFERPLLSAGASQPAANANFTVRAAPNPVGDLLHVDLDLAKSGPTAVELYAMDGKLGPVLTASFVHQAGRHCYHYDVGALPAGVYVLSVRHSGRRVSQKVLKI